MIAFIANPALANSQGLTGLLIHDEPEATISTELAEETGVETAFSPSETQLRVVNFWALWCVACREEMPSLQALDDRYDDTILDVQTIAVGPNDVEKIDAFFEELGITSLPKTVDAQMKIARAMGVLGLPATVLIDKDGNEVARLTGEADWVSEEAIASIEALLAE